ncbi:hypothetical protein [Catenulispora rubra]|uniref:hypothetical protein n=1 Tax=Catenulispora rubra TaxID=280293 RepID=UPI001891FE4F|nr:hypothetical protein [Catenulispora rubra]
MSETELTAAPELPDAPELRDAHDTRDASETPDHKSPDQDLAASDPIRRGNRLTAHFDRLVRRDIFGVNAAVLLFLLAPLAFGYYARLHWLAHSFPPDSRYYVTMTLRDLGWSDAHALTKQWTDAGNIAESWYFAHSDPTWLMVQSRMLYPFFAAPFVLVFGLGEGMPIASMVAFAVMLWAVARLVQRLYGPTAALAAGAVLGACGFMMNLAEAVTDPVAIAVLALILLNLPLGRRARAHNLVLLALLSVLLELSRQVMPTAAAMAFFAWAWATVFPGRGRYRRWRNDWLWPSAIVAGTTVFVHLLEGQLAGRGAGSQMSQVTSDPTHIAWTITRYDALSTVHEDRALSVLLVGALLFAVIRFTDVVSGLLFGAIAGTYVIMIAGLEPSDMRYESIMFPVAGLAVGALFHHLAPASLRGGVVGDGTLRSDRLPAVDTWWQRGPRRIPALGASAVVGLAFLVGWSATHGSQSMAGAVPTAPAAAAALAGDPHAELPDHAIAAEAVLSSEFTEAEKMVKGAGSGFLLYADWRHPMRYRPLSPSQPGWAHRGADGTAVLYPGDLDDSDWTALSRGFTFNGTLDPATVKVITRQTSAYGQDVTFTVSAGGTVHRGHATVVYPIRSVMPGIVTEMVFDS